MNESLSNQIQLFKSVFKGKEDVFVVRWEKESKSGYMPAYFYDPYMYRALRIKGGTFQNYKDKTYLKLSDKKITKHLNGVLRHAWTIMQIRSIQKFNTVKTIMVLNKLLLFISLLIFTSCNGQVKTKNTSKSSPTVLKNFKSIGLAPDFDTTLVSQYIRSIFQDSAGNLWFGTLGEGVVRYDEKTLSYFSNPDGFKNNTVYAINEDKNGNLWLGTDQGVYKYDGKTFKNYNQKDGLNSIDISRKSILVDKSGTIWVGTHSGVYQYDPSEDSKGGQCFSLFALLPRIDVAGIMEDKKGNIWFASSHKGVFRYDGKSIVNFNEKEGLGENYAGGIAQDKIGNMWFTMKNGICKFDGKSFTEYTQKDGLGGTEIWGIIIEQSGIIWITARGSTTRFDPSVPLPNPKAFIVFTSADGFTCCVQSMFQDKLGNMWWGTGQGLFRFNGSQFYQVKQSGPW